MKHVRMFATLVLAVSVSACGGGGGGGGGGVIDPGDGSTLLAASFTPDQPVPPPESVSMQQGGLNANLVTVRVNVTDTQSIFGAAFDVSYDPSAVEFVGWSPGTLLEQGGNSPLYQVVAVRAGRLVIGASRTGAASEVSAAGTQTLIQLTFRMTAAGSFPATFLNSKLEDSADQALVMSGGWHGGELQAI